MSINNQTPGTMNERERQMMMSRMEWTQTLGKKTNLLFGVSIANIIIMIITLVLTFSAMSSNSYGDVEGTVTILYGLATVSIVLAIVFGSTLISMGQYMDDFSAAGALYIASQICSVLKTILGSSSGLGSIFSLVSMGLSIAYVIKFSGAMIACFDIIVSYMSDSWATFKTLFLVGTIGSVACVFGVFFPGLAQLALLGVYGFLIMLVIVGIWQIILLRESAQVFLEYTYDPAVESRSAAGAFRNVHVRPAGAPPVPAAPRSSTMSRSDAIRKAEEMRKRREAKAAGIELPETESAENNGSSNLSGEREKIENLKQYKELLDSGVLTQEEFDKKKKEILGE
jgi:hypothetical protein